MFEVRLKNVSFFVVCFQSRSPRERPRIRNSEIGETRELSNVLIASKRDDHLPDLLKQGKLASFERLNIVNYKL